MTRRPPEQSDTALHAEAGPSSMRSTTPAENLAAATFPPNDAGHRGPRNDRIAALVGVVAASCARRSRAVLMASWLLALVAGLLASRLSVHGAFEDLLPPNADAVRQLHELAHRTRVLADYMVGVEAVDPALRARAADDLREKLEALDPTLVAGITADRKVEHRFAWKNRWLFAPLDELEAARDGLNHEIIKANPLVEDLEDDPPPDPHGDGKPAFAKFEDRLDTARKEANDPGAFVSKDGHLQLIIVRTTFSSDDAARGHRLTAQLRAIAAQVAARFPGVEVGLTGDVITSNAEHGALLTGMVTSIVVTVVLVVGALLAFYRSVLAVGALCWALAVGVACTFAYSWLTVGHLNIASAFLSSIVIGNGINFGLVYLARYLELLRGGQPSATAIGEAAAASAPGTLAAALTATVAYGSLAITPFRGFRDFGIIGAAGMTFCWLATYTILPAGLAWVGARANRGKAARLGRLLGKLVPESPRVVAPLGLALFVVCAAATARYVTHDPLEDDLRNLRSETPNLGEAGRWMHKFDVAFGGGISGGFAIGVRRRDEAPVVVAKLRAVDEGKPEGKHIFSRISCLDDLLPSDQKKKLAVLAEIRATIDSPEMSHLSAADRRRAEDARPPDDLRALTDGDVPEAMAWPYTERDGTRGKLILANTGPGVDTWRVSSLEQFARAVRAMHLGPDVVVGGSAFVFSDMLAAMERDGPRATAVALLGSVLVVVLLLGVGRYARVTLLCAALGTSAMLSVAWLASIKVNFLDFVALPITVGIGVDYAVNIAARARGSTRLEPIDGVGREARMDGVGPHARNDDIRRYARSDGVEREARNSGVGREAMMATGPVVLLCSYTTVVGYASLLFSLNRGIHTFGLSAMIGELTCVASAILLAPSLIDWGRPRSARRMQDV